MVKFLSEELIEHSKKEAEKLWEISEKLTKI